MVFETLVFSPFNHLTRLVARENLIILSRRENSRSYILYKNKDVLMTLLDQSLWRFQEDFAKKFSLWRTIIIYPSNRLCRLQYCLYRTDQIIVIIISPHISVFIHQPLSFSYYIYWAVIVESAHILNYFNYFNLWRIALHHEGKQVTLFDFLTCQFSLYNSMLKED
jgi:hypothetical protein